MMRQLTRQSMYRKAVSTLEGVKAGELRGSESGKGLLSRHDSDTADGSRRRV